MGEIKTLTTPWQRVGLTVVEMHEEEKEA